MRPVARTVPAAGRNVAPPGARAARERTAHPGDGRLGLHRLGAGQGAGGRGEACGCSTTIRAARRAACTRSSARSSSSAAISAMPRAVDTAVRVSTRCIISPSSTARRLLQCARACARCRRQGHCQCHRCLPRAQGVGRLVLASSSEVYQSPPQVPTDESAPLMIPDPTQPAAIPTVAARSLAS